MQVVSSVYSDIDGSHHVLYRHGWRVRLPKILARTLVAGHEFMATQVTAGQAPSAMAVVAVLPVLLSSEALVYVAGHDVFGGLQPKVRLTAMGEALAARFTQYVYTNTRTWTTAASVFAAATWFSPYVALALPKSQFADLLPPRSAGSWDFYLGWCDIWWLAMANSSPLSGYYKQPSECWFTSLRNRRWEEMSLEVCDNQPPDRRPHTRRRLG